MKVVGVVPIKLNSRRLANKNIRSFLNGQPLCYYILSTLLKIAAIDEVYVYCSNEMIKDYIPRGVKFLKRDPQLDQDTTKMNEVLAEFVNTIQADIYVMSHVTAPFVTKATIEKGLDAVLHEKFDSAFSVKKLQDFLWIKGIPFNYNLQNIPRTQDLDIIYKETSGVYIFERSVLLERKGRIGVKPYLLEVGEIEGIDIDEEEDFIIADAVFNYLTYLEKDDSNNE